MVKRDTPRLRTVNKVLPPYQLNRFPSDFAYRLGREIVYLLATKGVPSLEGKEWEKIFATCIGAQWKPSNVGLDDVVLNACAWGAKTVKARSPATQKTVRLISGRNSPVYSFGETKITEVNPDNLGGQVLSIWNERVSAVKKHYKFVRTVVLLKSETLEELAVFEFDTIRYDQDLYYWQWNKRGNLEGYNRNSQEHCFTWQPHGSQFTIIEKVPKDCLIIGLKRPPSIDKNQLLSSIGFDKSWIKIIRK
jgi:hypothetical protein